MSLWFILVCVLDAAKAGDAATPTQPKLRSQQSSAKHLAMTLSSDASGQAIDNGAWLHDLALRRLSMNRRTVLDWDGAAHTADESGWALSENANRVQNFVRSEQDNSNLRIGPEPTAISTGVGDLYAELQKMATAHGFRLRGLQLQIARASFIILLVIAFALAVQFSTQRLYKVRNASARLPSVAPPQSKRFGPAPQSKALAAPMVAQPFDNVAPPAAPPTAPYDVSVVKAKPLVVPKRAQVTKSGGRNEPLAAPGKAPLSQPSFAPSKAQPAFATKAPVLVKQGQRSSMARGKAAAQNQGLLSRIFGFLQSSPATSVPKYKAKAQVPSKLAPQNAAQAPSVKAKAKPKASVVAGQKVPTTAGKEPMLVHAPKAPITRPAMTPGPQPQKATVPRYPWHALPTPEMLLSVGPTFHVNLKNVLPDLLKERGLQTAGKGKVALIALWNWPGVRQRALVELCVQDTLANKRAFALHLARSRLSSLAPLTFLNPAALRHAAFPNNQSKQWWKPGEVRQAVHAMPESIRNGLWFLKHAGMDNNLGVTCFRGVESLLRHWEGDWNGIPKAERLHYVAQAEVQRPLLFPGGAAQEHDAPLHKVTMRAYVLVLGTGRCFLHREMLLKGHPEPYEPTDPDLMKHVLCHVKYDGVSSARGSQWQHYSTVWPKIADMMMRCFKSYDFEPLQDEAIFGDEDKWSLWRLGRSIYQLLLSFFAIFPFLRGLVGRPKRGLEEADSMKYALLGLDVIVDEDLRPWCLELNRSPTLHMEPRDPLGSSIKAEVVEDFCELLIDPVLKAAARAAHGRPAKGPWGRLQKWAAESGCRPEREPHRRWVELGMPNAEVSAIKPMQKEAAAADAADHVA